MADMNQTLQSGNGSEQGINDASRDAGTVNQTARAGNQSARDGSQGEHSAEPSAKPSKGGRPRRTAPRIRTAGRGGRPRKAKAADAEKPADAPKPARARKAKKPIFYITGIAAFDGTMAQWPEISEMYEIRRVDFAELPAGHQRTLRRMLTIPFGEGIFTLTTEQRHDVFTQYVGEHIHGRDAAEHQQEMIQCYEQVAQYIMKPAPALGTAYIRQGIGTNAISKIHKNRFAINGYRTVMDTSQGSAGQTIMQGWDTIDKATITFNGSADVLPPAAMQVLDILTIKATEQLHEVNNDHDFLDLIARASVVHTTVKEVARMLGVSNLDYVRKLIISTIKAIDRIRVDFYDKLDMNGRHTAEPVHWITSIIQAYTPEQKIITHGNVNVVFALMYAKYLYGCSPAKYPLWLLRVDMKHDPLCYPIGRKLFELVRIQGNDHITISFDKLVHICRGMVQYDEMDKKDKAQGYQRILVQPVETALEAIRTKYHGIISWKYTGKNGRELTDAETLAERVPYHGKTSDIIGFGDRIISITWNPDA